MGPGTREEDDREVLVNLAIYDYHAAIDRGESPDSAEWAARNPEIAPELHAYFDDLAGFGLLRPPDLATSRRPPGHDGPDGGDGHRRARTSPGRR